MIQFILHDQNPQTREIIKPSLSDTVPSVIFLNSSKLNKNFWLENKCSLAYPEREAAFVES